MFFSVKFGDDEKALFNPDCAVQLLIDDIKKRCGCPKQVVIDLIDEHGDLVHISEHSTENGTPLFTNRGNYILLEVKSTVCMVVETHCDTLHDILLCYICRLRLFVC
jgi:hypothetical protein